MPTSKCTMATGRSSRARISISPRLRPDTAYAYDFADPIFRLGNDYSKGIILSTGYIGQRTTQKWAGHPASPTDIRVCLAAGS